MKKFFFFRSSGSENKNTSPQFLKDKGIYWEDPPENGLNNHIENSFRSPKGLFSKSRKQSVEVQSPDTNPSLRRSRSLSTAVLQDRGLDQMNFACSRDRSTSPFTGKNSTPISTPTKKTSHSSRHSMTPDRKPRTKHFEAEAFGITNKLERPRSSTSHISLQDLSGNSSLSSSNISSKVVDRYIDGEQQNGQTFANDCSQSNHARHGQEKSRRPPRAQYTAPSSPASTCTEKSKSHSFGDVRGYHHNFPIKDWAETGYFQESPRRMAKNVVEKLSHCNAPLKTSLKDSPRAPTTIEDIYVGSLNMPSNQIKQRPLVDGGCKTTRTCDVDGLSSFHMNKMHVADTGGYLDSLTKDDETEAELQTSLKEANERAMFLSEEFEQQRFLCGIDFDVSAALIQKLKNLAEEKMGLAFEVSSILQSRITDHAKAKEELRCLKIEQYNQTQRLEREKNEIQLSLEKELDRRSSDWSLKLEKYQSEENRLRERVRELAEQNVAMQRAISALKEKEYENHNTATHSEQQLKDQTRRLEELKKQNQDLSDSLVQLKEEQKAALDDRDCFQRNYEEKENECKDLHKSITRLMRTTSEQEKTISELRESLDLKVEAKSFPEHMDKHAKRLQSEQIRLTGVEQSLRKEVESYKFEAESLRRENIDLINRLRGVSKEGCSYTSKFDHEMWVRIRCLQNQGLALLNDSTQMCSKLLGFIKWKAQTTCDDQQLETIIRGGLDGQFIVECDVKIQGYKRGIESLTRSLQTMSVLLNEKINVAALDQQLNCSVDDLQCRTKLTSERVLKSQLMSETLLTNLLREKLHCKELELEQLQAELATAVRGNDILKSEVQNALDSLSSASHTMKELELQNLKKDENLKQLQNDLQQSTKELTIIKGILPKVSDERDLMWEEVKQYSEKNMLLNSEIIALKKKIEALDEDVLVKEGQISILKDSLGRKPFDLIGSPDLTRDFLLD